MRNISALVFSIAVAISATALNGQSTAYAGGLQARSLIAGPIDEARLKVLPGNTHPAATVQNDRGAVEESLPLDHMQLVLQRPPELEQELESLMAEQQRKGSPQYHHWLTSADFGKRFGVSQADIEKVSSWLTTHGFRVDSVAPSGMSIEFSGNAGQVKQAFHTEIHHLDVDGVKHIANMSDPQIPMALADVVKGVHALHDFMPHSMMKKAPKFTFTDPNYGTFYAFAPPDLATIYNLNPAFTNGITGSGQTVVVIEDTLLQNTSDVATFRSAFGLSGYSGTFNQITATGTTTCSNSGVNSDEGEAALDAEWAGAAAPNAAIVLASCADTATVFGGLIALQNLINGPNLPHIVSISYGECEAEAGDAADNSYVLTYQQAAAEGVSVFVSSGDEGAASCDAGKTVATHGIAVSGFASTPYNVAVGGTDFGDTYENDVNGGPALSTYWSATNTSSYGSALSYIPEIPWNDSCASELLYTDPVQTQGTFTTAYGSTGFCNSTYAVNNYYRSTASGSGGPSVFSAKPKFQSVLGNPSDGVRDIPDVSLFAANGVWRHFLIYCMSDTNQLGATCDYTNSTDTLDSAAGGTSFSSPILAGVQALINQSVGATAGSGNPDTRLYQLGALEYGTAGSSACNSSLGAGIGSTCVFNDVTLGDIDVNCTGIDCYGATGVGKTAVQGVLSTSTAVLAPAYGTQSGWDFATGLGTVNVYNLIRDWTLVQTSIGLGSSLNPSTAGQQVTYTATVTPGIGSTETGSVTWSSNTGCAPSTLSNGQATCSVTWPASGPETVTATYSGDSNYAGNTGTFTQTVNPAAAMSAVMSTPTPSGTLTGSSVTFTWTAGTGVTAYLIHVGTTGAGTSNIYSSGTLHTTTMTVNGIPTTGGALNVRLYSYINNAWQYNDYTYTEANIAVPAVMVTPAPGSTLTGASTTFTWSAGSQVTAYLIHVGTTGAGSANIYSSGTLHTTTTTISGIPTTNGTLNVRLYSYINNAWQYNDYTYTEASVATPAVMTTPAPNSMLTGSSTTFSWSAGSEVTAYLIHVGTTGAGSSNIASTGTLHTTSTTISGIPTTGGTLNVRLYSYINNAWQYNDYTYTEQ